MCSRQSRSDLAALGIPAFGLVIVSVPLGLSAPFLIGNFLIGFGTALFGHGTLTATMRQAPKEQAGLALGAWGAVQTSAAGVAMAMSGVIRDVVNAVLGASDSVTTDHAATGGFIAVYAIEILLLIVTIAATLPILRGVMARKGNTPDDDAPLRKTTDIGPQHGAT